MAIRNGTQNTFSVIASNTTSAAPSGVSAGTGGGAMPAWTAARGAKVHGLVTTTYSMGTANHSLPTAVTDASARPFSTRPIPSGEKSTASTPSGGESGTGGGNMNAWTYNRENKLHALVRTTYSVGTNANSIPTAITDSYFNSFDLRPVTGGEQTHQQGGRGITAGAGGPDMLAWGYSRVNKLNALVRASFSIGTNKYTIPHGVKDTAANPFGVGFPDALNMSVPTKGVTYGPNYYNLLLEGEVVASPKADPTKPNPVRLADATIIAKHTDSLGTKYSFSTSQKPDGTFGLSISDYGDWTVSTTRQYLTPAKKELNVTSQTTSGVTLVMGLPTGGGGRNIGLGVGSISLG